MPGISFPNFLSSNSLSLVEKHASVIATASSLLEDGKTETVLVKFLCEKSEKSFFSNM